MKKLILLITMLLVLVVVTPPKHAAAFTTDYTVEQLAPPQQLVKAVTVKAVEAKIITPIRAVVRAHLPGTKVSIQDVQPVEDLDPPNADVTDLLNIPEKESEAMDWIKYVLGVFVFVFYEFIAGRLKTERSYKIGALIYWISNTLIAKDRAKNTGTSYVKKGLFKIQRE